MEGRVRDPTEAEQALGRALAAVGAGEVADAGGLTVGAFFDQWLAGHVPSLKPSTAKSYREVVQWYVQPRLGRVKLVDLNALLIRRGASYRDEAARQLARAAASEDSEQYRRRWLEHLLDQARVTEEAARSQEHALALAVEAMERRESARRAARRARDEHAVLLARETPAEAERLRRNARERARDRARREGGVTRTDRRRGMHAIAIVVDPATYQALKLEARHRSMPLPSLLGEFVIADLRSVPASPMTDAPRWRRTGEGRQANKHTRIDIDDEAWEELHADAIQRSLTVGRRIGVAIEKW